MFLRTIIKIGLFLTDDEWIHFQRNERTYEIICVIDGFIYLKEENREYQLEKDDIIILKLFKIQETVS